jgi:hypothetical protein
LIEEFEWMRAVLADRSMSAADTCTVDRAVNRAEACDGSGDSTLGFGGDGDVSGDEEAVGADCFSELRTG